MTEDRSGAKGSSGQSGDNSEGGSLVASPAGTKSLLQRRRAYSAEESGVIKEYSSDHWYNLHTKYFSQK